LLCETSIAGWDGIGGRDTTVGMRRKPYSRAGTGDAGRHGHRSDRGAELTPGRYRPEREVWGEYGV
jgi:hypothetical protein